MSAWHSRRPTFSLMGEYSSGKTALLNMLIGRSLLPTQVTATDLPAIWITKGKKPRIQGLTFDGTLVELTLGDLTSGQAMEYFAIRMEISADILEDVDIVDTPGISDPRMTTLIVEEIARYSDFAIWCSPANQAWRQTEKAFWSKLPKDLRDNSIMVLTRVDKLRSTADLEKILRRCATDAGSLFAAIQPLATPDAMAARLAGESVLREEQWRNSGGKQLLQVIDVAIEHAKAACARRPDEADPVSAWRKPAEKKAASRKTKAEPKSNQPGAAGYEFEPVKVALQQAQDNEALKSILGHHLNKLEDYTGLSEEHRTVLTRALSVDPMSAEDVARVVEQVGHEIEDFAESAWCELGR